MGQASRSGALRGSESDRGSATVLTIALCFVLLSAGFVGLALVQVNLVATHVQSAADLAALAGAQAIEDPCGRAQEIAAANGAQVTDCTLDGSDVIVQVQVPPPPLLERIAGFTGQEASTITAVARAGPPQAASRLPSAGQQLIKQSHRTGLVKGLVSIAALR